MPRTGPFVPKVSDIKRKNRASAANVSVFTTARLRRAMRTPIGPHMVRRFKTFAYAELLRRRHARA